jgi:hypothetical protein
LIIKEAYKNLVTTIRQLLVCNPNIAHPLFNALILSKEGPNNYM